MQQDKFGFPNMMPYPPYVMTFNTPSTLPNIKSLHDLTKAYNDIINEEMKEMDK